MPRVDFEVKPSAGIQGYWIAVGQQDVDLVNGKGSIQLQEGMHRLIWWFVGDEGQSISIEGKRGHQQVVQVKESKIPKGDTQGAGVKKFTL